MHTCIHTYIHTYIHAYIHTSMHAYIHTYIHISVRTCADWLIHLRIEDLRPPFGNAASLAEPWTIQRWLRKCRRWKRWKRWRRWRRCPFQGRPESSSALGHVPQLHSEFSYWRHEDDKEIAEHRGEVHGGSWLVTVRMGQASFRDYRLYSKLPLKSLSSLGKFEPGPAWVIYVSKFQLLLFPSLLVLCTRDRAA